MRRYYWNISQRDKENLIERAHHGSGMSSLGPAVRDGGDNSKIISKHKAGERDRLSSDLARQLIESSEPEYDFSDLEEHFTGRGRYSHGGSDFVQLKEDFREYLFKPYSNQDLANLSGRSASTCKEYRFEEGKSIPLEVYREVFFNTREILEENPPITGELTKPDAGGSSEVLLERADENDVIMFDEVARFRNGEGSWEEINNVITRIIEKLDDPLKGKYIKADNTLQGHYCSFMSDMDVLHQENKKAYRIEKDLQYFRTLKQELEI